MGGIAGVLCWGGQPDAEERAIAPDGSSFGGEGLYVAARARSTLARSERFVVAVAGRFDRSPATGQSAAETLLERWTAEGPDALAHFEGAWVAAVFERGSRRLHLLRDPFGVRRLYYAHKDGRLAFATTVKPLLKLPWVSREIARENLAEYLSFRYVHAPRTLLRDVRALPPGHHLVYDGDVRLKPWFSLVYSPPYAPLPEDGATLEDLERRINRSVAARASGRERVGVLLSGGLDSSAIALYASRLGPVHTFTVGVTDAEGDETPYAGRVANLLRTRHEVLRVDFPQYEEAFHTVVGGSDTPVTDPACIPQYLLARHARQFVDVILAGDGGDEVFGGRMAGLLAREVRVSTAMQRLPSPIVSGLAMWLGDRRPELRDPATPFGLARLIGGVHVFDAPGRLELLRDPGWVRSGVRRLCLEPMYREVVSDPVNEILHAYLRGRMVEDALLRSGTAASLAGIGLRAPMLDRDLVAFCARLPGPWKVRTTPSGVITKWPLREILRPRLGRALVSRPKRVLPGPWRRWFAGPARAFLAERVALLEEDPARLFLPGALRSLAQNPDVPGNDAKLWTLLFFDAWRREMGAG